MKIIGITDINDFRLGNAENKEKGTGCTVIVCEEGAVGGVDVRGGGPATRETDLLRSENTVNAVNAVVLSGGSAFGLESGSGVMRELADRKVGFDVGEGIVVPIVCGASLFDLAIGDHSAFPDVGMGIQAVRNAFEEGGFRKGNHGAGTGATVGKLMGHDRAMKTGLGTFACGDGFLEVGAIAAVNAVGDIYNGAGKIIAGLRSEDGQSIYGTIKTLKSMVHDNSGNADESTTFIDKEEIDKVITYTDLEEAASAENSADTEEAVQAAEATETVEASEASPEAEAVIPDPDETAGEAETEAEVEVEAEAEYEAEAEPEEEPDVPEESGEEPEAAAEAEEEPETEAEAEEETAADTEAEQEDEAEEEETEAEPDTESEDEQEAEAEPEEEIEPEPEPEPEPKRELTPEEMGYDIAFNTTISCLITNAELTKSQANKLASILHDAYARAIKPVHGTLDGDTVFVLASGKQKVNFDAFAALATDVLQYAVIDGAMSAEGAYGLPAARDMQNTGDK